MKRLFAGFLAVAALLVGCGSGSGNEYIGTWANVKYDKYTLVIERNGDSFIIRDSHPAQSIPGRERRMEQANIPAVLKDGMLQVNNGFGTTTLAIDKTTGNLIQNGVEFKKVNHTVFS